MTDDHTDYQCPLSTVDKRLDDVHRIWHRANLSYFNPEEFRVNAQHLIQMLRTVTFILQNFKRDIPDFEAWYGAWQERLRADSLMRWLVKTRNKIEKQGDLESKSYVRAEIIASYLKEGPKVEVEAHLFQDPTELFCGIPGSVLKKQVFQHGVLRIERKWVENNLPDHELLDALASAFATLHELVADAHRQMGLAEPKIVNHETSREMDVSGLSGRFPCMIAHEESRAIVLSLRTGERLEFEHKAAEYDPEDGKKAAERYGMDTIKEAQSEFGSVNDLANWYFKMARNVFLKDRYHQPFAFFLKGTKVIWCAVMPTEDRQEKYMMMRHLANEANRHSADGVMMINEVWIARADALGPFQYPNEALDRKEALCLSVARKDGPFFQLSAMIEREGYSVQLGETTVQHTGLPFFYAPFYKMWGRQLPRP
jgi:hypothetical protein